MRFGKKKKVKGKGAGQVVTPCLSTEDGSCGVVLKFSLGSKSSLTRNIASHK